MFKKLKLAVRAIRTNAGLVPTKISSVPEHIVFTEFVPRMVKVVLPLDGVEDFVEEVESSTHSLDTRRKFVISMADLRADCYNTMCPTSRYPVMVTDDPDEVVVFISKELVASNIRNRYFERKEVLNKDGKLVETGSLRKTSSLVEDDGTVYEGIMYTLANKQFSLSKSVSNLERALKDYDKQLNEVVWELHSLLNFTKGDQEAFPKGFDLSKYKFNNKGADIPRIKHLNARSLIVACREVFEEVKFPPYTTIMRKGERKVDIANILKWVEIMQQLNFSKKLEWVEDLLWKKINVVVEKATALRTSAKAVDEIKVKLTQKRGELADAKMAFVKASEIIKIELASITSLATYTEPTTDIPKQTVVSNSPALKAPIGVPRTKRESKDNYLPIPFYNHVSRISEERYRALAGEAVVVKKQLAVDEKLIEQNVEALYYCPNDVRAVNTEKTIEKYRGVLKVKVSSKEDWLTALTYYAKKYSKELQSIVAQGAHII